MSCVKFSKVLKWQTHIDYLQYLLYSFKIYSHLRQMPLFLSTRISSIEPTDAIRKSVKYDVMY